MPAPKFTVEEALSLRAQGLSYAEIAAHLGVHTSAVHRRLRRLDEAYRLRDNERVAIQYRRSHPNARSRPCLRCGVHGHRCPSLMGSHVHSPVLP